MGFSNISWQDDLWWHGDTPESIHLGRMPAKQLLATNSWVAWLDGGATPRHLVEIMEPKK